MAQASENVLIVTPSSRGKARQIAVRHDRDGLFLAGWMRLVLFLRSWREKRRSRRALDRLTADDLRDIGLTRDEARREYRKSFFIE